MYKKVNNGGDNVEREEISAGNQGKVKELVLFSLFTALTAIGAFIRAACHFFCRHLVSDT